MRSRRANLRGNSNSDLRKSFYELWKFRVKSSSFCCTVALSNFKSSPIFSTSFTCLLNYSIRQFGKCEWDTYLLIWISNYRLRYIYIVPQTLKSLEQNQIIKSFSSCKTAELLCRLIMERWRKWKLINSLNIYICLSERDSDEMERRREK